MPTLTFSRASAAYHPETGQQVAAGQPRYLTGRYGQGVLVEEGTVNLLPNPALEDADLSGQPDGWGIHSPPGGSFVLDHSRPWGGRPTWRFDNYADAGFYGLHGPIVAIDPTQPLTVSVLVACAGAGQTGLRRPLWLWLLDASFNRVQDLGFPNDPGGTHDWEWLSYTIPANAYPDAAYFYFPYPSWTDGGTFWIAAVQAEQRPYRTSWVPGTRSAEALSFPTAGVLDAAASTFAAWVRLERAPGVAPMSVLASGGLSLAVGTDGKPVLAAGPGVTHPTALSAGAWRHLAARWQSGEVALFVNGVKAATASSPSFAPDALAHLGSAGGTANWLDGQLDDVRVYSRALSDAEIAALAGASSVSALNRESLYAALDGNLNYYPENAQANAWGGSSPGGAAKLLLPASARANGNGAARGASSWLLNAAGVSWGSAAARGALSIPPDILALRWRLELDAIPKLRLELDASVEEKC